MKLLTLLLFSQLAFGITGNKVWRIPNGGVLPTWGPVNLADVTNAITGILPLANQSTATLSYSSSTGVLFTSSGSYVNAGVSVAVTGTGRPAIIGIQPDGTSSQSFMKGTNGNICSFQIRRNSTTISTYTLLSNAAGDRMPFNVQYVEPTLSGAATYEIFYRVDSGAGGCGMEMVIITALLL